MSTPTCPPPATAASASLSPRPTGLHRGLSYIRSLHLHTPSPGDDSPGESQGPKLRPRATTPTPSASQTLSVARPSLLVRRQTSDAHQLHTTNSAPPSSPLIDMTRTRAETVAPQLAVRNNSGPTPSIPRPLSVEPAESSAEGTTPAKHLPSIRFIPHQDPRAGRPSLQFPTITRTLPDEAAIVRVGRYSERDNAPEVQSHAPSAAAVGFKSKVVSRKHCELWCTDGNWFIKDVKSSSGTFLNHIRLSQPNVESKPFRIKDGDIIQLGIDFRGGEEMIFRCVKIRVECNRGWQQGLNTFNKQTHQRLRNLAKSKKEGDTSSMHTSECVICLMSIAPCQSLFVAPCSHVWHYKCIRPILNGPTWPNFLCPNCRAVADLEEDVEDPGDFPEDWDDEEEQANGDTTAKVEQEQGDRHMTPRTSIAPVTGNPSDDGGVELTELQQAISNINIADALHGIANQPIPQTPERPSTPSRSSVTRPVSINLSGLNAFSGLSPLYPAARNGLFPDRAHEGPMTPRNDVGPFVLDGSAGRTASNRLRDTSPASDSGSSGAPGVPPVRFD